jgi:diguanylate cyclase (GGDEF)-like protein
MALLPADGISLGFWISPHELRRFRARCGEAGEGIHEDILDPERGESPLRAALKQGSAEILTGHPRGSPEIEAFPGHSTISCLVAGLKMRDEPPGVLTFHRFRAPAFGEDDLHLIRSLSPLFVSALENLRRFAHAEELSITDGLTGVYNYRYLRSALDMEVARAKRYEETFSIIMLDVDHLKEYNDVHGHLQGSEVLRRIAQVVSTALRGVDLLAKYGGDEFVIILPHTDGAGAKALGERIRAAVERAEFPGEEAGMKITSSMGIAQFPQDGETSRDLIESADRALYDAKRSGRNRVIPVSSPE